MARPEANSEYDPGEGAQKATTKVRMRFKNPLMGPNAVAVVVDIRSSSQMLDDLVASGSPLDPYIDLVGEMKHTIAPYTLSAACKPYKFTGDGWIVLFDGETPGAVLYEFTAALSACYARHIPRLLGYLTTRPVLLGLTFGIDNGSVKKLTIFQHDEYIGHSIIIACRLQAAARDSADSYVAYVSEPCFNEYFATIPSLRGSDERVKLKGVDHVVRCKRISVAVEATAA